LLKLPEKREKDNNRSSRAPSLKLWRKRLGSSFVLDEERNKEIKAVNDFAQNPDHPQSLLNTTV
jgi:hypothetical protein